MLGLPVSTIRGGSKAGSVDEHNQNKKLKLASWGQKPVRIFGSSEIRSGKDTKGNVSAAFQTLEDDSGVSGFVFDL